ncbi:type VII secretion protein EccB [Streptomyces sp. NPDC059740]|uniref:type VII secretion protein EccB n=1 Tax=Streptomyces sp. NPDC059740 TaxID=3346926 RepID=UPI00364D4D30
MQTRRDHLQAYQFATARLASSLVSGDPGKGEAPMHTAGLGAMFGVMLAGLLVLGSLVYGFLSPAEDTSWKHTGALVVQEETGTRYLYVKGELHPTLNYASALLAAGGGSGVTQVPRASLSHVPRGSTIGIPGAPDDIAEPASLLAGAWTDCLRPGTHAVERLDFAPKNARPLADTTRVLVAGPDAARYVVWKDTKYPVKDRSSLLALGLDSERPVQATRQWLDALPDGASVSPATIPGAGRGGRTVAGHHATVGSLFRTVVGSTSHYYVLRGDGMAPLNQTEAALLAAQPGRGQPATVSPTDIAAVPSSSDSSLLHRLPDLLASKDTTSADGSALCLRRSTSGNTVHSTVVREGGRVMTTGAAAVVPTEHAVLAAPPKQPGATREPAPFLISDQGVKYQLAGDAAQALGFGSVTPRTLPASTLDQIPDGPQLSRTRAVAVAGTD